MRVSHSLMLLVLAPVLAPGLAGCGKLMPKLDEIIPDRTLEYRKSESLPDLEVPPDLSIEAIQDTMAVPDIDESGTATFSSYQDRLAARARAREAGEADAAAIQALAEEQLIVVEGSGPGLWQQLRGFWAERGVELELDDAELGVLETGWLVSEEDFTRERYKIFAEPGQQPGTTVFYLSQIGEVQQPVGETLVWVERPRDTVQERRTALALGDHLGAASVTGPGGAAPAPAPAPTPAVAGAPAAGSGGGAVELVSAGGGRVYLRVPADFAMAWRDTGEALGEGGFELQEADRGRGIYFVRYRPESDGEEGLLSRLAFWREDAREYQLSLTGVGGQTEVVVLDEDGNWDASPGAAEILQSLRTALNRRY